MEMNKRFSINLNEQKLVLHVVELVNRLLLRITVNDSDIQIHSK